MNAPLRSGSAEAVARLREALGERVVTTAAAREAHGRGEGEIAAMLPDAVVFARSTAEVAHVAAVCDATRTPLIPFGAGSSLEGQLQAPHGGISLDLTGMDRVLSVSAADLDCRVEAGVTRQALNAHIRGDGLIFPLDPGAEATLGGMAATRASGTNAVRYGTMREVVLGLTVVTPQGRVVRTGGRAKKSSMGYDLTRLYLGSEGTLGVITELQLRLFGAPEHVAAAACPFPTLDAAVACATLVLQTGVAVARMELMDALQMRASAAYSKLDDLPEAPTLMFEFHGSPAVVADQVAAVREIAAECGGGAFRFAETPEARTRLWTARHNAYWAVKALRPGCECVITDACVPLSALAACIVETQERARADGLTSVIIGHVGDGNFHAQTLYDPADAGERAKAHALADDVGRRAIAAGGTVSGEHGVGLHRLDFMREEHGEDALDVMRAIKHALDPRGIMNPGKTVPGL